MPSLPTPHTPPPATAAASRRPWAVTAIGWLLLIETAGLLTLAIVNFGHVTALAFATLAVLALAAAIGFARLRRGGWLNAVLLQGGGLALALLLYLRGHVADAYLMMVYGILMVLYLHQADVQAAFRLAPGPEQGPP
jgi:hypothetical protein